MRVITFDNIMRALRSCRRYLIKYFYLASLFVTFEEISCWTQFIKLCDKTNFISTSDAFVMRILIFILF